MRPLAIGTVSLLVCLLAGAHGQDEAKPNHPKPTLAKKQLPAEEIGGSLFLHGGGAMPKALLGEFLKLFDRPTRLVVIPTAAQDGGFDPAKIGKYWKARGFSSVEVLHTRSREQADREDFCVPLRRAGAVWISGGQQSRLESSYVGTRVERELHALLARGGVIGGSSAGAAVMSRVMIRSGSPDEPVIGKGFGLIPGAVIDQHFVARKRIGRLRKTLEKNPGLIGYGIDEGTALILNGRRLTVAGISTVTTCLAASEFRKERHQALRSPQQADHIALSRAALERASGKRFPAADPVVPKVRSGTVVAFGGGSVTRGGLERFVAAAGGKKARILVIYTAKDGPNSTLHWRRLWDSVGVKNVALLHARTRAEANSTEFVKRIDAAGGVWFGGGRQWRLVDRYSGTAAEAAIARVLERGGAVGGSSAGATILGEFLVRGDPLTSETMIQEGYERGFGLVPGTAIDQHFSQRGRGKDMLALKRRFPQLYGFGIDEGMAIAFEGSGCRAYGRGKVFIYPPGGEDGDGPIVLEHRDRHRFAADEK